MSGIALNIVEFFGYSPEDTTPEATNARIGGECPFVGGPCTKMLSRDNTVSGVCTVRQTKSGPIIVCPNRLYGDDYKVLKDIVKVAFGSGLRLLKSSELSEAPSDVSCVVAFGKGWGKELKLPRRGTGGSYFVDWVLARIGSDGGLMEFVAVEIQSMDTTGNYRSERSAYLLGEDFHGRSVGGINWENVNKRILPQLIYKGHVLRRERLCKSGLFFVCPTPVYQKISERLGGQMLSYDNLQPGSITFQWYNVDHKVQPAITRGLRAEGQFKTTVDQVANAFTAPTNLPPANVYEDAIRAELSQI